VVTLLHSCVKMREAIKLPFGLVSGNSPGIGVYGSLHFPREGEALGVSLIDWFEWHFLLYVVCKRLTVFFLRTICHQNYLMQFLKS